MSKSSVNCTFCWRRTRHRFCYGLEERTPSINASMTESLILVPLIWIIHGYSSHARDELTGAASISANVKRGKLS